MFFVLAARFEGRRRGRAAGRRGVGGRRGRGRRASYSRVAAVVGGARAGRADVTAHVLGGREGAPVVLLRPVDDDVDLAEEQQSERHGGAERDGETHRQHLSRAAHVTSATRHGRTRWRDPSSTPESGSTRHVSNTPRPHEMARLIVST